VRFVVSYSSKDRLGIGTRDLDHPISCRYKTHRQVGSMSHVVHYGASRHETSAHYFSCSGGPSAVSIKSVTGHVMPNLCFCIRWYPWVT
jgi:hypothetical protein